MVTVTSSGGFMLRRVFSSAPPPIGHRLRVRLHDDRLEVFLGGTLLMTLSRETGATATTPRSWLDYRHVIHSLRANPGRFSLVCRDRLFPAAGLSPSLRGWERKAQQGWFIERPPCGGWTTHRRQINGS